MTLCERLLLREKHFAAFLPHLHMHPWHHEDFALEGTGAAIRACAEDYDIRVRFSVWHALLYASSNCSSITRA